METNRAQIMAFAGVASSPSRNSYCSILRAQVEKMDKISPKRRFSDKDEWASVLSRLQEQGKLTHQTDGNKIILEKDE